MTLSHKVGPNPCKNEALLSLLKLTILRYIDQQKDNAVPSHINHVKQLYTLTVTYPVPINHTSQESREFQITRKAACKSKTGLSEVIQETMAFDSWAKPISLFHGLLKLKLLMFHVSKQYHGPRISCTPAIVVIPYECLIRTNTTVTSFH